MDNAQGIIARFESTTTIEEHNAVFRDAAKNDATFNQLEKLAVLEAYKASLARVRTPRFETK